MVKLPDRGFCCAMRLHFFALPLAFAFGLALVLINVLVTSKAARASFRDASSSGVSACKPGCRESFMHRGKLAEESFSSTTVCRT